MIGDLRDRKVISPHLLGKIRLLQTLQAHVEPGDGEAFDTQRSALTCDQLNCVSETSLT